jgi:hypothetical protein
MLLLTRKAESAYETWFCRRQSPLPRVAKGRNESIQRRSHLKTWGSHQMTTALCERLGIELPIIQAPMGGVVGPILASSVSNAGGLGMLSPWRADIDTARRQIRETRVLTSRPFGVNLNLEFPQEERLAAGLDEGIPVISFFWRDPSVFVPRAKAGGAIVMHTSVQRLVPGAPRTVV